MSAAPRPTAPLHVDSTAPNILTPFTCESSSLTRQQLQRLDSSPRDRMSLAHQRARARPHPRVRETEHQSARSAIQPASQQTSRLVSQPSNLDLGHGCVMHVRPSSNVRHEDAAETEQRRVGVHERHHGLANTPPYDICTAIEPVRYGFTHAHTGIRLLHSHVQTSQHAPAQTELSQLARWTRSASRSTASEREATTRS